MAAFATGALAHTTPRSPTCPGFPQHDMTQPQTSTPEQIRASRPHQLLPPFVGIRAFSRPTNTTNLHREVGVGLPKWQPDSEVAACPICSRQFSFWFRKHHCRKCGRVVCANCSPHRITIPQQSIVHPPGTMNNHHNIINNNNNRPSSTITTGNPVVIDLTGEPTASPRPERQPSWTSSSRASFPVLEGGEEVRLCNPCVPDPQPSPQSTMDLAEFLRQRPGRDDEIEASLTAAPHSSRSVQIDSARSPGHGHGHHSASDEARELRRQRGRGMIVSSIELLRPRQSVLF